MLVNIIMIIGLVIAGIVLLLALAYLVQNKSRKRFIKNMTRQIPYLIGRYFA